jgi:ABC-type transporter Mla subunit MlaD
MKININDLFDFSDFGDINKLEKKVKELDSLLSKFSDNLQKDIDDNIKSLNKWEKQIDSLNVSLEKEATLIIQIEKNISGLTQQQSKLTTQQDKVNTARKETVNQANKAKKALTDLEKVENQLAKATGKDAEELAKKRIELANVKKETKQSAKEALGLVNAYGKLAIEATEAKNEAKDLGAQLNKVQKEFGETSKEATELGRKFQDATTKAAGLDKELKDIDAGVGDFQRNVGNYSSALDGVKQGFGSVLEFATPAGLALAAAGLAIEGIGALAEVIQETNTQLKETAQLTGLSGQALDDYTASVRATSKVFDQEYKEVLNTVNQVTKEFGIESSEAIDLINLGFTRGADINGSYLDQLRQFAPQFTAAGLSAKDLFDAVAISSQQGFLDDKFLDTIKESGLRLRELTKAQEDALAPLGKARIEAIKTQIEQGKSFKATQLVAKGLTDIGLTAKQTQTIFADVFGGAGEDLGARGIKALGDFDKLQKEINSNLTEQQKRQLKVLEVEQELATAQVKLGEAFKGVGNDFAILGKQLQTLGIEGIVAIIDELKETFNELAEPFNEVVAEVEELKEEFGGAGDGVFGFIKKLNPLTFVLDQIGNSIKGALFLIKIFFNFINDSIDTIKFLSNAFVDFATSFDFVNVAIEKTKSIYNSFLQVIADTPKFFNGLKEAGKQSFTELAKIAKQTLTGTKDLILSLFTFDATTIKAAFNKSIPKFQESGKEVAEAFQRGFNSVEPVKVDEKKVEEQTKEVEKKVEKTAAGKDTKKVKEETQKRLDEQSKLINDAAKKEQLQAIENRNNNLISEQEYQDELLLIEVGRIEKEIELREAAGLATIDQQKALQQILLDEKKKGEQQGLKDEEIANKNSLEADKKALAAKKALKDAEAKAEADRKKEQQEKLSDPVVQAGLDGLETRIENELLLAGVQAFRAALERGEETQVALQEGTKAVAAAQVFKTLSSGFHDGGYTGDGNEYDVAGVVHKGEFVMTKNQTSKYGFNGSNANDFDNAVRTGYFNQFSDVNDKIFNETNLNNQIVLNNDSEKIVQAIKNIPSIDMSFVGKDLQQRVKEGNLIKTTKYRGSIR